MHLPPLPLPTKSKCIICKLIASSFFHSHSLYSSLFLSSIIRSHAHIHTHTQLPLHLHLYFIFACAKIYILCAPNLFIFSKWFYCAIYTRLKTTIATTKINRLVVIGIFIVDGRVFKLHNKIFFTWGWWWKWKCFGSFQNPLEEKRSQLCCLFVFFFWYAD